MAMIATDLPKELIEILMAVDYTKITTQQYNEWDRIVRENIGKFLKKRTRPATLANINLPINQKICDTVNEYDFATLSAIKRIAAMPMIKMWAKSNLPLTKQI